VASGYVYTSQKKTDLKKNRPFFALVDAPVGGFSGLFIQSTTLVEKDDPFGKCTTATQVYRKIKKNRNKNVFVHFKQ
jgi:hypothetical protein